MARRSARRSAPSSRARRLTASSEPRDSSSTSSSRTARSCSGWRSLERDAAARHRRLLHDRRRRLPVDRELVDHLLEVLDVADEGFHEVAVLPGDAVALDHLWGALGQVGDLVQLARRRPDADHDAEREAHGPRIDLGPIALDHTGLLEPGEALGYGR